MAQQSKIDQAFSQLVPDFELLEQLYHKEQKGYLRTRLKAIRLLWTGKSRADIVEKLDIDRGSLLNWMKDLLKLGVEAGLYKLAESKKAPKTSKLTLAQESSLLALLENETPADYGYEQNIFTGKILVEIIQKKWQIKISDQSIYNIFKRHGYSYQRGHRDYENADPVAQHTYAETLKTTLAKQTASEKIVFFDEFSVTNRPSTFYGWAPVNTKFKVPSNEKKETA